MNRHYETKIARKTHLCMECDREIKPGEIYHRMTWDYNGYYVHYLRCLDCDPDYLDWLEANAVPESLDVV